jgi:hypothetical protein
VAFADVNNSHAQSVAANARGGEPMDRRLWLMSLSSPLLIGFKDI